jgi:hypothetical protein
MAFWRFELPGATYNTANLSTMPLGWQEVGGRKGELSGRRRFGVQGLGLRAMRGR